ncbi:beta-phosphoglucomutase [Virgibacillus sp. MG-45]|uniref:beta-phosphoglucomutase n=1 Tax=Virgibacillus sp. MG-45 TaxID=3102791 RepID=UPI002EDB0211
MVKGFIFDLDGVITDTADLHYLAWKELGDKIGIAIDPTFNQQLKGIGRMESLEKILHHGNKADVFSAAEKAQLAEEKNEQYKQLINRLTPDDILPGIPSLLLELRERQIKIGLASASKNAPAIIENLELTSFFDSIADAGSVASKPAPDIFLLAAAELAVEPSEAIGIEDAISGITAIQRAGMFAVGVGDKNVLQDSDYIVPSTAELSVSTILEAWERHKSEHV